MNYVVAVRTLCEFTAKEGDLDLRFTPSSSAQEGMAGHAMVASRRGPGYQTEVSLAGEYQTLRETLQVRGRADGWDEERSLLEEIKTYRGELEAMPENRRLLHWAQVKVYGALMCRKLGLAEVKLSVVYYDVATREETALIETHTAAYLEAFFTEQCERFIAWGRQEMAHRSARDEALLALRFPYDGFRVGQRQLSESVYKAASLGRCLMAQAPTGIGKTVGTLFPLLQACPTQKLDKVFFLAAKGPGRGLALDALSVIRDSAPQLPLRVVELVARDKACEHPDKACHGDSCPLARGFYDRLPEARQAAVEHAAAGGALDKAGLRRIALDHEVCPYYLAQELVRWSDVVVGDYNYYFDLSAMLHGLTVANQWRVSVLVDEAHNLIERARKMYSATLEEATLDKVRRSSVPRSLSRVFERLAREWTGLKMGATEDYQVHDAVPAEFSSALQQLVAAVTDHLADNPTGIDSGLLQFYFDALHFTRVLETFGDHSLFDVTTGGADVTAGIKGSGSTLCLRNIVPAPFLKPRFATARCTVLFSATLSPWHFYADTLGLPDDTGWIDVESPFKPEQLSVRIASHISTRFQHRQASVLPIADLIAAQYLKHEGNYLAFFSSFDYLDKVAALLRTRHPQVPLWQQSRQMSEPDRRDFLARFSADGRGVGFAVLGGAFAEGIDLPGKRLIGAFIVTLGLPQINPVNEQVRQRMETAFGAGYDYTYLFPGLQKVVQAAGRVIRTVSDEGVVLLIDDRFERPEVKRLLPVWWQVDSMPAAARPTRLARPSLPAPEHVG
ncbi:MAG: ATP-dependent helicase [Rhizobacter sp.]|nr:ATP-dependent helicase [Rhizobacter sp.]